ncbi:MAG: hypothetical protein M1840_003075 [Geoglossum simile]|nr:MAG: hypothetical protein M1840_003075 [Geoglossum simile]
MLFFAAIVIALVLAVAAPHALGDTRLPLRSRSGFDLDGGRLAAVSSESSLCSQIGIDLVRQGGNAADAMVGTVFCIGTTAMYHSGIGGGGFMLVRAANGSYEFIDFRESAPRAAYQDMFVNNTDASLYGGLASGVPGEIRGLEHLHKKYGILPWATVMLPAIQLARNGFPISEDLDRNMKEATKDQPDFLVNDPSWAIDFAPNGTRLGVGDIMTRKRLANTLERIAEDGADVFYNGPIADYTIAALKASGGTMVPEDLRDYKVVIRNPVEINYRNYRLTAGAAPSGGSVVLSVLNIIKGFPDMGKEAILKLSTHRLVEAMKFGYGMRTGLGDPSFLPGLDVYERNMLNSTTASNARSLMSDYHTLNTSAYDPVGLGNVETPGTSHLVSSDASGLAISLTTTVNRIFGSRVMVPETGIVMNNEMNDFSIPGTSNSFGYIPSPSNFIRAGKRPLSSTSPVIVEHLTNRSLYFVVGAAGGSRIITATIQNLWHVLDRNLTAGQALAKPRLHHQLIPNELVLEWAYDNGTAASLKAKGHNVTWIPLAQSGAAALRRLWNGRFEVASEPRYHSSGGFVL